MQVATIPIFSGNNPDEVSAFLTRLRQLKVCCNIPDNEVIMHARGKVSPPVYRSLEQYEISNGTLATLEQFNSFIKEGYGDKLSVYQLLQSCCDLPRNSGESWLQYNIRINVAISKVKNAYSEFIRDRSKPDSSVSTDQVYDLFQSSILLANK